MLPKDKAPMSAALLAKETAGIVLIVIILHLDIESLIGHLLIDKQKAEIKLQCKFSSYFINFYLK